MKADRLIELICHPEKAGNDDLRELDTLIHRYPYFQGARVLYLKALHIFASARFRNELKSSTMHLPDHRQLYKYLNNLIEFDYPASSSEEKEPFLSERVTNRIQEINGYLPVNTFGIPAYQKNSDTLEKEEEKIIDIQYPHNKTEKVREAPVSFPTIDTAKEVISNPIRLDDIPGIINDYAEEESNPYFRQKPIYETIEKPVTHGYVIETVSGPAVDISQLPGTVTDYQENTEKDEEADSQLPSSPVLPEEEKSEPATAQTPLQKHTSREFAGIEGIYRLETMFPEEENDLSIEALAGELKKKKEIPEKEVKAEPLKKQELIEKFIIEEPSIPRGKLDAVDDRDLSEESNTEKEDLFSETLAKIYIKQKLYEKAIATYIKLSLKYPEKSVYFAHRIEKIKEQINNNQ